MSEITYSITIGSHSISNESGQGDATLISLECTLSSFVPGNSCKLELTDHSDLSISPGDDISISLGDPVFSGKVQRVEFKTSSMVITGHCPMYALHHAYENEVYTDQTCGDIISDLCSKYSVSAGTIESGASLGVYRINPGLSLARHIDELRQMTGTYVISDSTGTVQTVAATSGSSEHTFTIGENIIDINLHKRQILSTGITVYGEGSASSDGQDKAHWYPTDISSVKGDAHISDGTTMAGEGGDFVQTMRHGSIRTGESASSVAESKMKLKSERKFSGSLVLIGDASVSAAQLCSIENDNSTTGVVTDEFTDLRIREVTHYLNSHDGFITEVKF